LISPTTVPRLEQSLTELEIRLISDRQLDTRITFLKPWSLDINKGLLDDDEDRAVVEVDATTAQEETA
jgi:hypothetical protein